MPDTDASPPPSSPVTRVGRWLRLLKLLLGVAVSALTLLRLLGVA
jgi:hypothetical protein